MSKQAREWAKRQRNLRAPERLVLWYLADRADERGHAFPSARDIAESCGVGLRSVARHIDTLKEAGLLTVANRFRENGGKTSNGYQLCLTPSATVAYTPSATTADAHMPLLAHAKDNEPSEGLGPQTPSSAHIPPSSGPLSIDNQRAVVTMFRDGNLPWDDARWQAYGPPPGKPGCRFAPELLREFGYGDTARAAA